MEITLTTWGQEEAAAAEPGGNGLCGMGMGHGACFRFGYYFQEATHSTTTQRRPPQGGGAALATALACKYT